MAIVAIRPRTGNGTQNTEASSSEPLTHSQVMVSLLVSLIVSFLG